MKKRGEYENGKEDKEHDKIVKNMMKRIHILLFIIFFFLILRIPLDPNPQYVLCMCLFGI